MALGAGVLQTRGDSGDVPVTEGGSDFTTWQSAERRAFLPHLIALEGLVAAAVRQHLKTGDQAWEQQAQGIRGQISWLKLKILNAEERPY
jgi:hypothetical protein